ncbi:MAG: type IV secretory system conjugative DNA transfer family protein [Planctomycetota bacterium]|jgi:type IV secretory pathway TraG/TraD family ATPase VirD4|nr:type IV secretory system conjugative DNA transfer family protein [Planctomycetota bacterium]
MNELNNQIGESGEQARKWRRVTIAVILFSFAAGFVVATQYFARLCAYDAALGFNIGGWYFPAMIVVWTIKWHSVPTLTEPLRVAVILGVAVAGGGMFIYLVASHIAKQSARGNAILHGSAHWASEKEIRDAQVLDNPDGVYIGAWKDKRGNIRYLRDSGPAHVLCFAPTRSGKGVGLVLPTLLSWQHSAIVADLKGELWELTAGWRKEWAKNKVIRFEPGNPTGSAKWNPFDEIRIGTEYEFADVSDLSQLYERYVKDESITSNCHVQIAFPPNRFETAKYLSDMLGTTTVKEEHYQTSGKRIAIFNDSVNKSINLTQRPLLTPDETMTLPGAKKNQAGDIIEAGDMVIKIAGFAPIYGKQPLYFQDPVFSKRSKLPAPKETDKIEKIDEGKTDNRDEEVSNEASEVSAEKATEVSEESAPAAGLLS